MTKHIVVMLGAALLACVDVQAQAVSQIAGTVRDQSGASIPGVELAVTQTETGIKRTTISDDTGYYVLANLPLGPYRLEGSKTGFRSYVQTGIVLQVGTMPEIPVVLDVGVVTETVSVQANASQVETRTAGVGSVVENQRVLDLPLNGRQPTDLITLSGAAVQAGTTPGYSMNTGVTISVAGGTSYSVQYNLDGAPHLNVYVGTGMPLPFPDALQEFRLTTSAQDASGGGHSGASVNVVTRSGTNQLHGDIFEFIRNADLNGRTWGAPTNDQLKRNQFGGVIGLPILKDKLFLFTGYQGTIIRQSPSDTQATVPTQPMLSGDFSQFIANSCPGAGGLRGLVNGHLSQPLSPAALNIAAKLPQTTNPCGVFLTGNPLSENQLQIPLRVDFQLSDKQTVFGRYLRTRDDTKVPYTITPNNLLTTNGFGTDDLAQSLALGDTYIISPSVVNSLRLSGNRIGSNHPGAQFFSAPDVGIKAYSYVPQTISLAGAGFSLGGSFSAYLASTVSSFAVNDDVNVLRGSHQFVFGVSAMRSLVNAMSNGTSTGTYNFTTAATGLALADFLIGNVTQLRQSNPNPLNVTQNFLGVYIQDTWKVTPGLTFNYGLRWNPFFPMSFKQGDVYNFSLANFYSGVRSIAIPSAPPGFTYPGDRGFPGKAGLEKKWGNLEPRLGIAWDPFGDGKTALRAGAGIGYDFIRSDVHLNTSSVEPFRLTVIQSGVSLDNPYATFPGGNPFPYSFDPAHPVFPALPGSFLPIPPDMRTTKQYSWNLGIQRQLTPSWFAAATYMGTELNHLWNAIELNPAQFISGSSATPTGCAAVNGLFPNSCAGNTNQRRLLANQPGGSLLQYITQFDDGGTQSYNGLLLNTTLRVGQNLNLNANYTWSHCIGLPVVTLLNNGSNYIHSPYQNNGPVNRGLDTGNCNGNAAQDRRHIANVTLVAKTPKFNSALVRKVGTGWTLSTIYQIRSGAALTPVLSSDQALNGFTFNGTTNERPDQVLADPAATNRGASCSPAPCVSWFNPGAYAIPAPGSYGNAGPGSLAGPKFWEWDEAVTRQFSIREGQQIEVRGEAFNITNSVRFNNPIVVLSPGGGTFGRVTSSVGGPRILQFALKYVF